VHDVERGEESWQTVKIEREVRGWQGEQKGQREKAGAFGYREERASRLLCR
jgi:hypothetical protein